MEPGDADDRLLRASRAGDDEAFLELWRRHRAAALARCGSQAATHELFVHVHARLLHWDVRETFAAALQDAASKPSGRASAAPESEPDWEEAEDALRAAMGAAPRPERDWLERFLATDRGSKAAAAVVGSALLIAAGYAAAPIVTMDPLPPYAATSVLVEQLTPSATAAPSAAAGTAGPSGLFGARIRRQLAGKFERLGVDRMAIRPVLGEVARFTVRLDAPSDIRAIVTTKGGDLVRSIVQGHFASGGHPFAWDGADGTGRAAIPGVYTLQVTTDRWGEQRKIQVVP